MNRSQQQCSRKISGYFGRFAVIFIAANGFGCTSFLAKNNGEPVRNESAYLDSNRAPVRMQPAAEQVAESARTKADYHYTIAEALSMEGRHEEAIEEFKSVLIYDVDSDPVHLRLATEYVKIGRLDQALNSCMKATELNPKSTDAWLLLGGIYGSLKKYSNALNAYEKVLQGNPNHFEANLYAGAVFAEQKEYPRALEYFYRISKSEDASNVHIVWYYIGRVQSDKDTDAEGRPAFASFQHRIIPAMGLAGRAR